MDRKLLTIILSAALIGCCFLPFLQLLGTASLFDILTQGDKDWETYIGLLIPVSAIILLVGALNNERYFISRFFWALIAFLTVLYYPVRLYLYASGNGEGKVPIGELIKVFGYGYWAMLGIALILLVVNPKSKYS